MGASSTGSVLYRPSYWAHLPHHRPSAYSVPPWHHLPPQSHQKRACPSRHTITGSWPPRQSNCLFFADISLLADTRSQRIRWEQDCRGFSGNKHPCAGRILRHFPFWLIHSPSINIPLLHTICYFTYPILHPLLSSFFYIHCGIVTTSFIRPGASHVPSFYAPSTQSDRWSRMVVFALFGVIFGGLHCIGWSFKFPTHPEQTLWRSTSLAITAIPLIVAPIDFFLATRLRIRDINTCPTLEKGALLTLDLVMTILLFVYIPARLSLIAQALALVRSQPASALTAVDWTKYVPHLFSS